MNPTQFDVIVVAGGAAGLSAAISAAQAGARVVLIEKADVTGGTANRGMGPLAIESRHTRLRQMRPTKDEAFKVFMDYTHWRVDAKLVRAYLNKSGDTIDWLEAMGVAFAEPASYFIDAYPTWHLVQPDNGPPGPGGAATMMRILTRNARELGVDIRLSTQVTRLIKDADRVCGVAAVGSDGAEYLLHARSTIVATGGFGDNPAMIADELGFQWGSDLFSFRIPGLAGDGMKMAWAAGAARTDVGLELIYGMPKIPLIPPKLHEACRQPHLMVNLLGERFIDESILPNVTFTANALVEQKQRCGFLIFDQDILAEMEVDFDFRNRVFPATRFDDAASTIRDFAASGYEHFFVCDSIEELAAATGIDGARLAETIASYNGDCDRGYDTLFAKPRKYLRPIRSPRFYAARHLPGAYGTLGGIKINHRTEVLDTSWNRIDGLYAAGMDACSIYGDSYVFVLPGNSMGFAINSGRIAGENAAQR